jgi:hypothetical protein
LLAPKNLLGKLRTRQFYLDTLVNIFFSRLVSATLIGVLGMAHFSLGRGSGSFMGGFLIGEVGTRDAFRYMGLVAGKVGFCGVLNF